MFGFKKKKVEVLAYSQGKVIPLSEVSDEVFSSGMMGEGFAIRPDHEGTIIAPFEAEVVSVFPTKHAISLRNNNGVEVLLHFGLDTVELDGVPFDVKVKQGDKVDAGEVLASIDLKMIVNAGKETDLIFVIPDRNQYKELVVDYGSYKKAESFAVIK